MYLLILLGIPLFSALMLAIIGDRKYAPEVNILGSAATCAAGIVLAFQVYEQKGVKSSILTNKDFPATVTAWPGRLESNTPTLSTTSPVVGMNGRQSSKTMLIEDVFSRYSLNP